MEKALEQPTEIEKAIEEASLTVSGWRAKLIWKQDARGRATFLKDHIVNVTTILANDERWSGCLSLNEFSQIVDVVKRPPHESGDDDWLPRPMHETDLAYIAGWLAADYNLFVSPGTVLQSANAVAHRNSHHPVREYLDALEWDGIERLSHWLEDFTGAISTSGSSSYIRSVGRAWMVQAVARIYQPGCKADHVLILEGMTGIKKSTVFYELGKPWFTDQISDMGSKDSSMQTQGVWIIELAELDAMTRHEVGRVKAFLTIRFDRIRPPYGHTVMRYDRQCVFAGTVNHTDYLRDETGNRRFWPVRCADDKIKINALADARDQLWAEAVMAYKSNERWWLEDESAAAEEQEDRMTIDPWEDPVSAYLAQISQESSSLMRERAYATTGTIFKALQIPIERQGLSEQRRVISVLKRLKWTRRRIRMEHGGTEWRYLKPL